MNSTIRVVLLGSNGMLGREIIDFFKPKLGENFFSFNKNECEITSKEDIQRIFEEIKPTHVINAAGFTNVDECENNKLSCLKVNGEANELIAKEAAKYDAAVIYISTDYVFNGENKNGYNEDDSPAPINAYGKSKLLGEELIKKNTDKFYIIRTSWLFSKYGKNFVKTMIKIAKEKLAEDENSSLKVVDDQIGCPTYAKDLAKAIFNLIQNKNEFGIYHISNTSKGKNENGISWFEFAKKIFQFTEIPIKLEPITSEEINRKAQRPKFSILLNNKLPNLRNYEEALEELTPLL